MKAFKKKLSFLKRTLLCTMAFLMMVAPLAGCNNTGDDWSDLPPAGTGNGGSTTGGNGGGSGSGSGTGSGSGSGSGSGNGNGDTGAGNGGSTTGGNGGSTPSPAYRILFVGNSLTYYNDMPALLMQLGLAAGKDIYVEKVTVGSSTMCQQTSLTTEIGQQLAVALEKSWDFVIIQPSRRITDKENTVYEAELAAGQRLDAMIKAAGAKTIIYNTWGNNTGNSGLYVMDADGVNTKKTGTFDISRADHNVWMQSVSERFSALLNAPIVDTASLFEFMMTKQPAVNVYYTDERHPSLYGSFAVACAFYDYIYNESAVRAASLYHDGIEAHVAELLAKAADYIVLDGAAPLTPVTPGESLNSAVTVEAVEWTGTGTKADPFIVASAGNFMHLVKLSSKGESFQGKYIKQTANVDLKGGELMPVGVAVAFKGNYNGGGFQITDYSITNNTGNAGLFALCEGATIENVVVGNATFKGLTAGSIAGTAKSGTTVRNCVALQSSSIEGSLHIGGFVGLLDASTVEKCVNLTTTTAVTASGHCYAGGIVGLGKGGSQITLCYNVGAVTVTNTSNEAKNGCGGGILGCEGSSDAAGCNVTKCVNEGLISFTEASTKVRSYTGGIVGRAATGNTAATISYCYNLGNLLTSCKNTDNYDNGIGQICGVFVNKTGIKLEYCYGLDTVSSTLVSKYGADPRNTNYVAGREGSKYTTSDYFQLSDKLGLKTSTAMASLVAAVKAEIPYFSAQ